MVEIITLPSAPVPKKETAHYYSKTLYDHFVAFQNQNNKQSFVLETPVVNIELLPLDKIMEIENASISDYLILIAQHEYMTEKEFSTVTWFIKSKMTVPGVYKAKLQSTFELLSHLFGYRTHSALKAYARLNVDVKHPGMVRNFRGDSQAISKALFDTYGKEKRKQKLKSLPSVKEAFKARR